LKAEIHQKRQIDDYLSYNWRYDRLKCPNCGFEVGETAKFCSKCGTSFTPGKIPAFIVTTTPFIEGYKIKKILGVVTGLTPRTRGVGGKFIAGIQSMLGGEVTAFTTELEKARVEAIQRVKSKASELGANAIVGLDLETSNLGLQSGIVVISATGTAVIIEPV
jgi:uncharacterized protein YbjQ (UPF0145 family)